MIRAALCVHYTFKAAVILYYTSAFRVELIDWRRAFERSSCFVRNQPRKFGATRPNADVATEEQFSQGRRECRNETETSIVHADSSARVGLLKSFRSLWRRPVRSIYVFTYKHPVIAALPSRYSTLFLPVPSCSTDIKVPQLDPRSRDFSSFFLLTRARGRRVVVIVTELQFSPVRPRASCCITPPATHHSS